MKRLAALACIALVGCGGWNYNATPTQEVPDNKPSTAVANPPRCFVVDVHRRGFWRNSNQPIGMYCRVDDPTPKAGG